MFQLFIGEDADEIVRGVESIYPYSFSDVHDESGHIPLNGRDMSPACGNGLFQGLYFSLFMRCAEMNCGDIQSAEEVISCISTYCLLQYAVLSQECLLCLSSSGPRANEIKEKWVGIIHLSNDSKKTNRFNFIIRIIARLVEDRYANV